MSVRAFKMCAQVFRMDSSSYGLLFGAAIGDGGGVADLFFFALSIA